MIFDIVFVSGNFNILHPGHLRLLKYAKDLGHRLCVGVISDKIGGDAVHVHESDRLQNVKSIKWVDEAFIVDESIEQTIRKIKPQIVVKGKEHEGKANPEAVPLAEYGGHLIFSSGESTFSSHDLIYKHIVKEDSQAIKLPLEYIDRHHISIERLVAYVERFQTINVCVLGDLIVDEYITCTPLGMSQEDPTIVVTPIETTTFVGGAGIVAAHAAGLHARVDYLSVVGNDAAGIYAQKELNGYAVCSNLIIDSSRHTTLKQRFRANNKTLLRVNKLSQSNINHDLQDLLKTEFLKKIKDYNLIVFSDFNYGCLPQSLVDWIADLCTEHDILMVADSQCSSQIGDITRYKNMCLLTPTENEARISLRNQEDGLIVLANEILNKTNTKNLFIKLASDGCIIHSKSDGNNEMTDQLPALNNFPKDVAGAGDSMLITSALALAVGATIWEAALLGSVAAALQVGRVGNYPLQKWEVLNGLRHG